MRRRQSHRDEPYHPDQCPICGRLKNPEVVTCYICSGLVPEYSKAWEEGDAEATEFYVYIMQLNDGTLYVGQTRDIRTRKASHQNDENASTRGKDPKLIWYNTVRTRDQATNLEFHLKYSHPLTLLELVANFNAAVGGALPDLPNRADFSKMETKLLEQTALIVGREDVLRRQAELMDQATQLRTLMIGGFAALAVLVVGLAVVF